MSTLSPDDLNLISAFLDGELDAPASLAIERRIERDAEFAHEYRAMLALSGGISAKIRMESASDGLRQRLEQKLEPAAQAPSTAARLPSKSIWAKNWARNWSGLTLAAGLSAIVASGATYSLLETRQDDPTAGSLVAAHLRGLLAQRPIDIETSDRHTVKPWFNERLSFSPIVPEEPIADFDLLGGRMDYVGGQPAATLVYRHRSHFISLTQARADAQGESGLKQSMRSGLTEMHWRKDGIAFYLITDLPAGELAGFARHWQ